MTADGVYRRMLWAYPARFRREYGDGMLEAFRDLRRHTARGPLGFWLFLIADTVRAAAVEHTQAARELLRSSRCRWITACAIGATACGGLGSLATWTFSYFYHPYLEGTAFVPWAYGALLGAGLAFVQALALGRRLPFGTLWIMTSACCAATILRPDEMIGQRPRFPPVLRWPYREGLRLDEALHPLTIIAVGLGFYTNVNPTKDHPGHSQARERRLGEFFMRPTLMFNGYGDQVAAMYEGMDLRRFY